MKAGVATATVPVPLSCDKGYFLSAGTCTVCSDGNSHACSSASVATGCNLGYFLNTNA